MVTILIETIRLGVRNLTLHLLRSTLTALGIILGIAAVILMMAIAEGSKQSALKQFEILGARVVILRSARPPEQQSMTGGGQSGRPNWVLSYGLTRQDYRRLVDFFEDRAELIVPLKEVGARVTHGPRQLPSQTFGTTPDLTKCANFGIASGRYITEADIEGVANVCVVGHEVARTLFPLEDPLGRDLRVDNQVFRIVGVMKPIGLAGGSGAALVGRDLNKDVHIPISTAEATFGDVVFRRTTGQFDNTRVELSEVYLMVPSINGIGVAADMAERTIALGHTNEKDFEVIVPYELQEVAKRMARIWTWVMVSIAAIALFVGGTGIMNIMLASVTERTREIGIRRALGATRRHIMSQFLVETGVLSLLGGVIGIVMGVGMAMAIDRVIHEQLPTQITGWSIIVSFVVAVSVGLVFGLYPAQVAADQDPIVALRHD